jgi:hypothetical protein
MNGQPLRFSASPTRLYLLNWSAYQQIKLDLLEDQHILSDIVYLNGTDALNSDLAATGAFRCYFETDSANGSSIINDDLSC